MGRGSSGAGWLGAVLALGAGAALGFSCVCTPSECEPTAEADCPPGAGTVWDPCGCCRVCARTENQPCGGPYGFYGSCGRGLQCVVTDVSSDGTEGTCKIKLRAAEQQKSDCSEDERLVAFEKYELPETRMCSHLENDRAAPRRRKYTGEQERSKRNRIFLSDQRKPKKSKALIYKNSFREKKCCCLPLYQPTFPPCCRTTCPPVARPTCPCSGRIVPAVRLVPAAVRLEREITTVSCQDDPQETCNPCVSMKCNCKCCFENARPTCPPLCKTPCPCPCPVPKCDPKAKLASEPANLISNFPNFVPIDKNFNHNSEIYRKLFRRSHVHYPRCCCDCPTPPPKCPKLCVTCHGPCCSKSACDPSCPPPVHCRPTCSHVDMGSGVETPGSSRSGPNLMPLAEQKSHAVSSGPAGCGPPSTTTCSTPCPTCPPAKNGNATTTTPACTTKVTCSTKITTTMSTIKCYNNELGNSNNNKNECVSSTNSNFNSEEKSPIEGIADQLTIGNIAVGPNAEIGFSQNVSAETKIEYVAMHASSSSAPIIMARKSKQGLIDQCDYRNAKLMDRRRKKRGAPLSCYTPPGFTLKTCAAPTYPKQISTTCCSRLRYRCVSSSSLLEDSLPGDTIQNKKRIKRASCLTCCPTTEWGNTKCWTTQRRNSNCASTPPCCGRRKKSVKKRNNRSKRNMGKQKPSYRNIIGEKGVGKRCVNCPCPWPCPYGTPGPCGTLCRCPGPYLPVPTCCLAKTCPPICTTTCFPLCPCPQKVKTCGPAVRKRCACCPKCPCPKPAPDCSPACCGVTKCVPCKERPCPTKCCFTCDSVKIVNKRSIKDNRARCCNLFKSTPCCTPPTCSTPVRCCTSGCTTCCPTTCSTCPTKPTPKCCPPLCCTTSCPTFFICNSCRPRPCCPCSTCSVKRCAVFDGSLNNTEILSSDATKRVKRDADRSKLNNQFFYDKLNEGYIGGILKEGNKESNSNESALFGDYGRKKRKTNKINSAFQDSMLRIVNSRKAEFAPAETMQFESINDANNSAPVEPYSVNSFIPTKPVACGPTKNPCCTTKNPCCTTKDPCATTKNPCCTTKNPCCTTKNPCCTTKDPCCTTKDPCATTKNPCCTTKNPCGTTKNPCCTTKNPCCTTKNPCCTTKNPCCTTKDPCATTKDPCATTKDPCATTKNPCSKAPCCPKNPFCPTKNPCKSNKNAACTTPCCPTKDPCATTKSPCCPSGPPKCCPGVKFAGGSEEQNDNINLSFYNAQLQNFERGDYDFLKEKRKAPLYAPLSLRSLKTGPGPILLERTISYLAHKRDPIAFYRESSPPRVKLSASPRYNTTAGSGDQPNPQIAQLKGPSTDNKLGKGICCTTKPPCCPPKPPCCPTNPPCCPPKPPCCPPKPPCCPPKPPCCPTKPPCCPPPCTRGPTDPPPPRPCDCELNLNQREFAKRSAFIHFGKPFGFSKEQSYLPSNSNFIFKSKLLKREGTISTSTCGCEQGCSKCQTKSSNVQGTDTTTLLHKRQNISLKPVSCGKCCPTCPTTCPTTCNPCPITCAPGAIKQWSRRHAGFMTRPRISEEYINLPSKTVGAFISQKGSEDRRRPSRDTTSAPKVRICCGKSTGCPKPSSVRCCTPPPCCPTTQKCCPTEPPCCPPTKKCPPPPPPKCCGKRSMESEIILNDWNESNAIPVFQQVSR